MSSIRLANIPFTLKASAAPVAALMLLLYLIWEATSTMSGLSSVTRGLVDREINKTIEVTDLSSELGEIHGDFYAFLTKAAADPGSVEVADEILTFMGRTEALVTKMTRFQNAYLTGEAATGFQDLIDRIGTYGETIEFVGTMLEFDFATATGALDQFEENYSFLITAMKAIVDETARAANDTGQAVGNGAEDASSYFQVIGAIATLIAVLLTAVTTRDITNSIKTIGGATKQLANDDLSVELDALARKDELGMIVGALSTFRDNIEAKTRMEQEQASLREETARKEEEARLAKRDAEKRQQEEQDRMRKEQEEIRVSSMNHLADQFDSTVTESLTVADTAMTDVNNNSNGVHSRASENRDLSQSLMTTSSDVTGNMQTVAAATEELTASIAEIAQQVSRANDVTRSAVSEAGTGRGNIKELSESVERIGEVIGLITDIADQTNLLALNATIEAARAGEAGRGFAVVASEVKNLSAQTASATEEISQHIEGVQGKTDLAVKSIEQISTIIQQVDEIASGIACAVEE